MRSMACYGGAPVAQQDLLQPFFRQPVGRDLRFQVSHRSVWKTDVIADQMPDLFIQLTGLVELDLIELQALHPGIQGVGASKTGAEAADIHPVSACRGESEQLAPFETRR